MANIIDDLLNRRTDEDIFEKLTVYIKEVDDLEILTMKSSEDETLIYVAIDMENEDFLCAVLEKYPQLAEVQDEHGDTFVHRAAANWLESTCLKTLEVYPKATEIQNEDGDTFVHKAATHGLENTCLKTLEVYPKAAEIQNEWGGTFVDICKENRMTEVVRSYNEKNSPVCQLLNKRREELARKKSDEGMGGK